MAGLAYLEAESDLCSKCSLQPQTAEKQGDTFNSKSPTSKSYFYIFAKIFRFKYTCELVMLMLLSPSQACMKDTN